MNIPSDNGSGTGLNSKKFQEFRLYFVSNSIPQRIVVTLFCSVGAILISGLWTSMDRMLMEKKEILLLNQTTETTSPPADPTTNELVVAQVSHCIAYTVSLVPMGMMADKYGVKNTYLAGMTMASVVSLMLPLFSVYFSWSLLSLCIIFLGISQSVIHIAEAVMLAHWAPSSERACLGGFVFGANPFGYGFGHMLCWIVLYYKAKWFSLNLFWGFAGLVWCFLYLMCIYEDPSDNPHIASKERQLLHKQLPPKTIRILPPWKEIMMTKCIWALLLGQMGHEATMFIMILPILSYTWWYKKANISFIGFDSLTSEVACLFLLFSCTGLWLMSVSVGVVADHGVTRFRWDLRKTRRITTCLGFILSNPLLLVMVNAPEDSAVSKISYVTAALMKGAHYSSFQVNFMDITRNFPGFVLSIMLLGGNIANFMILICIRASAPNVDFKEFCAILVIATALMVACVCLMNVKRPAWDYSNEGEYQGEVQTRAREVTFTFDQDNHVEEYSMEDTMSSVSNFNAENNTNINNYATFTEE